MPFWSGEKLKERLDALVEGFDADKIDCAAYTLSVGYDCYVTPSKHDSLKSDRFKPLEDGESITIPAGQFAFLTTKETISVPNDALAFISMKATEKYRGLVNVSGFHVDPGFQGQLIFSVLNAAPGAVTIKQGQELFLIWYADLDRESKKIKTAKHPQRGIPTKVINGIPSGAETLAGLSERLQTLEKLFDGLKTTGAVILALLVPIAVAQWNACVKSPKIPGSAAQDVVHSQQVQMVAPQQIPASSPKGSDVDDQRPLSAPNSK